MLRLLHRRGPIETSFTQDALLCKKLARSSQLCSPVMVVQTRRRSLAAAAAVAGTYAAGSKAASSGDGRGSLPQVMHARVGVGVGAWVCLRACVRACVCVCACNCASSVFVFIVPTLTHAGAGR